MESPNIYQFFKFGNRNKGRDIITLIDGSPFLSEYILGQGRILLFNVAPVLSWSNFPLKGIFAPLLTKSVFYLTSQMRDMEEYLAGDNIPINLKNNSLGQIKITRPNNLDEFVNIDTMRTAGILNYSNTNLPGTYKFYSADKLIDFAPSKYQSS